MSSIQSRTFLFTSRNCTSYPRAIVSHHYVRNKISLPHMTSNTSMSACSFRMSLLMCVCIVSCMKSCLTTFPFNKSLLFVIEYESNVHTQNKITILYGGSLGSLFDEERSKVRESNANCRTHWAWITRTHLAAKAPAEAKFASVLFLSHQIHLFPQTGNRYELLASSIRCLFYLACNTYRSYDMIPCFDNGSYRIRMKRSYTHTQTSIV